MPRKFAIIVAGGKGLRMGGEIPKQFMLLAGKPVLMHTLQQFASCRELILVLPQEQFDYWQELCTRYNFTLPHRLTKGGETRYHSVRSGLQYLEEMGIEPNDLVAIHDGVRPLVTHSVIDACYQTADRHGAALPYRPLTNSIRQLSDEGLGNSRAVERSHFVSVHTPQVFNLAQLLEAYQGDYKSSYTDDASVWEDHGYPSPILVESNPENIKLTTPIDLRLAELYLND